MFTLTRNSLRLSPTVIARGTADEMRLLRDWLEQRNVIPFPSRARAPAAARRDPVPTAA